MESQNNVRIKMLSSLASLPIVGDNKQTTKAKCIYDKHRCIFYSSIFSSLPFARLSDKSA